ncbi:hypothetical protein QBC36DRAFT_330356 [Triangularia setosa]|uniref:Uncharacterized protein n=1 Tax=Triangularia setosa TaxID=2587417 RepID=A0AAN6W5U1_9PEZI|nr:hypothetical protein QBC36DRAFT_330356 [Podospora setosa]
MFLTGGCHIFLERKRFLVIMLSLFTLVDGYLCVCHFRHGILRSKTSVWWRTESQSRNFCEAWESSRWHQTSGVRSVAFDSPCESANFNLADGCESLVCPGVLECVLSTVNGGRRPT